MAYKYESALLYIADITAYLQVKAANVSFLFFHFTSLLHSLQNMDMNINHGRRLADKHITHYFQEMRLNKSAWCNTLDYPLRISASKPDMPVKALLLSSSVLSRASPNSITCTEPIATSFLGSNYAHTTNII